MSFHNEKPEVLGSYTEQHETVDNAIDIEPPDPTDEEQTLNFKWDKEVVGNLTACFLTYFTTIFAIVVPTGAIGFIIQSFPEESGNSIWITAAFTVASTCIQAFCGDLSDQLGRKGPLSSGMLLGLAGTILAGRATNLNMVIGGQVLSGAGSTLGNLCIPLIQEIVPKSKRPQVMAVSGIFPGLAYCTGNVISGAFIKGNVGGVGEGWRCGFYLSAGFYAASFLLITCFYHPSARPNPENLPMSKRILKIDWLGVFLITAGLSIFLVGLQSGGNAAPWDSARVLACLIVGGAVLVAFTLWEWKGTSRGILAHGLFIHRNYGVTLGLCLVGGMVLFGGQAFIPQEVIYLFTSDAVLTGVWGMPFNAGTVFGAMIGGIWLAYTREAKPIVIFTFLLLILGTCLMLVIKPGINFAAWFFSTGIMGLAVGIQTTVLLVIVTLCTPDHLIGAASSVSNSLRAVGGSVGVVIFSQVFASKVKTYVPNEIAKETILAGLPPTSAQALILAIMTRNTDQIAKIPGVTPQVLAAAAAATKSGYSKSFKYVWYSLIPFAVVSMGVAFLLQPTSSQMTHTVAAGVQRRNGAKTKSQEADPE